MILYFVPFSRGVVFWGLLGALAALTIYSLGIWGALLCSRQRGAAVIRTFSHLAFASVAIFFSLGCAELLLVGYDFLGKQGVRLPDLQGLFAQSSSVPRASLRWVSPTVEKQGSLESQVNVIRDILSSVDAHAIQRKESRRGMLALPPEWQHQAAPVDGAPNSFYWHGVLHLISNDHFRRNTEFPPKDSSKFRIMVVGDSLTYGQGIEEQFTYPVVIERELQKKYHVEVLNLGACGYQSEDELAVVRAFLPSLNPNLVIYGSCLNDFLPSGVGQGVTSELRVPAFVKDRSRVGQLFDQGMQSLAVRFGWSKGFYEQVLEGIDEYKQRYSRDVGEMNSFVRSFNLPPVIAMVLNQDPVKGDPGYELAMLAEDALTSAGMDVIPTSPMYEVLSGKSFRVSQWEAHPDEEINYLFGILFARELESTGVLESYRK